MKKNGNYKPHKTPAFVARAGRALRRAARNAQTQNRILSLPLIIWKNGKLIEKPA